MQKTQKSEKNITFFIKGFTKVVKMNVLSVLAMQNLINAMEKLLFCSTSCTFTENPCAKMRKTQKSDKTIMFYMKNCKNEQFCFIFFVFFAFLGLADPFGQGPGAGTIAAA